MDKFQLGRKTILDPLTPEFIWLQKLIGDKVPRDQLVALIIKCLGGDELIADAMIETAQGNKTRTEFAMIVERFQGKMDHPLVAKPKAKPREVTSQL